MNKEDLLETLAFELAKENGAYLILLEHRFYGESFKPLNLSMENLQFLTIEQALADTHEFIKYFREQLISDTAARIILMGWQYAGNLATWYHQLHPDVATGVWASSAPLLAKINFTNYMEVVGEAIQRIGGRDCYERIDIGIKRAEYLYGEGLYRMLEREFSVCNATGTEHNIRFLTAGLAVDYGNAVKRGRYVAIY